MKMVSLVKEGKFWTMYLNEVSCGCGDLEDMKEEVNEVLEAIEAGESIEEILEDYTACR